MAEAKERRRPPATRRRPLQLHLDAARAEKPHARRRRRDAGTRRTRRRTTGATPPRHGPQNAARSHWQISRVNSVLGRGEAALYHAERCLGLCTENGIGDWDLAAAYEGVARAHKVAGNEAEFRRNLELGREALDADRGRGGPRAHRGGPRRVGLLGRCRAGRDGLAELLDRRFVGLPVLLQRLVGPSELLVRHRLLQALDHAAALALGRVRLLVALAHERIDRLLRVAVLGAPAAGREADHGKREGDCATQAGARSARRPRTARSPRGSARSGRSRPGRRAADPGR